MKEFKRLNRKVIHKGAIIDFCNDDILTSKGMEVVFDYIDHKGAAAVIPVMDDGKILMVKQWRNAIDRFSLEIPAGGKDSVDEPTEICAVRELTEETGYSSNKIEFLQTIVPAIAYSGELIDVYVAFDLKKEAGQKLDPDEDIEFKAYTVEELLDMIKNNQINDSKTISAITTYYIKYCLGK